MTPLATQATRITIKVLRMSRDCQKMGLPGNAAGEIITNEVAKLLQEYQDELLESQRQTALTLEQTLGRK